MNFIESGKMEDAMTMNFQVVDVNKALLSVYKVCEAGHDVIFSKNDSSSAILIGGDPKNRIPLRRCGGTYELDVWLRPTSFDSGFSGPE